MKGNIKENKMKEILKNWEKINIEKLWSNSYECNDFNFTSDAKKEHSPFFHRQGDFESKYYYIFYRGRRYSYRCRQFQTTIGK